MVRFHLVPKRTESPSPGLQSECAECIDACKAARAAAKEAQAEAAQATTSLQSAKRARDDMAAVLSALEDHVRPHPPPTEPNETHLDVRHSLGIRVRIRADSALLNCSQFSFCRCRNKPRKWCDFADPSPTC